MGADWIWAALALGGFLAQAGLIVVLGLRSTERYEFERNRARERQQAAVAAPAATAAAGARQPSAADTGTAEERLAASVATHPAGRRLADQATTGWWLVDEARRVVAGPFADRIDAEWAAFSAVDGTVRTLHGVRRPDGSLVRRQSPEEQAWLAELGQQLDRLGEDWDALLTDEDPLTTLVVEVIAGLVEAGLPLHDCAGEGSEGCAAGGGVCLLPELSSGGVLVAWRQHDRAGVLRSRGAEVDAAVQQAMDATLADVLTALGFVVERSAATGGCLVVDLRG